MLEILACFQGYFVPLHGSHIAAGLRAHENCPREYPGVFSEVEGAGHSLSSYLRVDSWKE